MKNLYIIILSVLLIFMISGCEPDMELSNPTGITTGNYYKTADQLTSGVNAAYNMLQRGGFYGRYGYYSFNSRGDDWICTDKAVGIAEIIPVSTFNAQGDNLGIYYHWRDAYVGVYACNLILEKIDEASGDISEEIKNRLRGEASFMRGFFYLQLCLNFGEQVPHFESTPLSRDDYFRPNAPKGKIYNEIIEDFSDAVELLPARSEMFDEVGYHGRATKGAALGFLGKTYLYRPIIDFGQPAEFDKAAEVFEEIIESGEYELVPNFRDNHSEDNENNIESLFEVQFENDEGTYWNEEYAGGNRDQSTWREQ